MSNIIAFGLERSGMTSRFLYNKIIEEKRPIIYFSTDSQDLINSETILANKIVYQNNLKDDINFNLIKPNVIFKYTINIYNHLSLEKDLISIYRIINFIYLYKLDELVVIIDKIPQVISFQNLYILKNLILGLTPNTPIELIKKLKIKFNEVVLLDINNSFYLNSKINEILNEIKPKNLECIESLNMFKNMYLKYPKFYDLVYNFNENNISTTYDSFKLLK